MTAALNIFLLGRGGRRRVLDIRDPAQGLEEDFIRDLEVDDPLVEGDGHRMVEEKGSKLLVDDHVLETFVDGEAEGRVRCHEVGANEPLVVLPGAKSAQEKGLLDLGLIHAS